MSTAARSVPLPRHDDLRQLARVLFREALAGCDPAAAVRASLRARAGRILLGPPGQERRRVRCGRVRLVALGKAACPMAAAALEIVSPAVEQISGLAIAPHGSAHRLPGIAVRAAAHPVPDLAGLCAARELAALARGAGREDLVLALVSGGGSSLAPLPVAGVTLADKVSMTRMLLEAGADIRQLNVVRRHLSRLKGGGLARLAWPAAVHALLVSDVVGDDPAVIASGPTVPDPGTFADALEVLEHFALIDAAPPAVVRHLQAGAGGRLPETPKPGERSLSRSGWHVIASGAGAVRCMARSADAHRAAVTTLDSPLTGEARAAAGELLVRALGGESPAGGLRALLGHGETTVRVRGRGRGGRNQELALAFALAAEHRHVPGRWVLLSAGTDGIDGPTDAAGAIVDAGTPARIRAGGGDPVAMLADNDSYHALRLSGDLLKTGPTGTNVADIQVFLSVA